MRFLTLARAHGTLECSQQTKLPELEVPKRNANISASIISYIAPYRLDHRIACMQERAEYPLFDWLRFVLASTVVFTHTGLLQGANNNIGNLAVQVFFALSGFLIGGILLQSDLKSLPQFYFNRATRIWIPYFIAIALLYGTSALRDPINRSWLTFLVYDLTFTHNWFTLYPDAQAALAKMPLKGTGNHFWSIAVEEQFYLLAPVLICAWRWGQKPIVWVLIFCLLLTFHLTDFASISAGLWAATLRKKSGYWYGNAPVMMIVLAVGVLAALLCATALYWYAAPFFAIAVVLLLARPGNRSSTVGLFAGGISYELYLNQWIGFFAVHLVTHQANNVASKIFEYSVAVAVSAIIYLLVDRNVLRRRQQWFSPRIGAALAFCGYLLLFIGVTFGLSRIV
jgi:peptidoglycan/LPS O-acetylase OafA/YrhL